MAWTTIDDVEDLTGTVVTATVLAQAEGIITIFANRTDDMKTDLRPRDLYWLVAAVAWQAVWLARQTTVEGRNAGSEVDTEGLRVKRDHDYDVVLAPLAARALKNLSWKGSRTLQMGAGTYGRYRSSQFGLESSDPFHPWLSL